MIRALLYSLIGIIAVTFMRMVIGIIMKGLGEMMNPAEAASGPSQQSAQSKMPAGGELKRDPVCGTFVPATTSITAELGGKTYYYCSKDCRNKHKLS